MRPPGFVGETLLLLCSFVAADVCRALEVANPSQAVARLDDDEKAMFNIGLSGGDTNCVKEPGPYTLVFGSRKQEMKMLLPSKETFESF